VEEVSSIPEMRGNLFETAATKLIDNSTISLKNKKLEETTHV
jgi:hypothetical protein